MIVFSGDGGFNEVLNGIGGAIYRSASCPAAARACSRARSACRAIRWPPRRIADSLLRRTRRISTGRVNGRRFALRRRDRHRRGGGAQDRRARRARRTGERPGDLAFVATFARMLVASRGRARSACSRSTATVAAAFVLVANVTSRTRFLKAVAIKVAPEAAFEQGLDFVAPVSLTPRDAAAASSSALATGRTARTRSAATISTGSRSRATSRCRCRPTARISAT